MRRGLGYGVDAKRSSGKTQRTSSGAARVSEDEDQGDSDEMDEHAVEAIDLSEGMGIIRGRNGRPPTKVTTLLRRVEVLAEISFVPLEGRVDARAARQSVRALQPRQVIVLGGPKQGDETEPTLVDEVTLLAEAATSFVTDKKPIPRPSDMETCELEVGHAAYAVRLIDTAYQPREEKEAGKEPPPPIEMYEAKLGACHVSLLDAVATGQKVALDGSIVLAPRVGSNDDSPKIYLSDGDILLTDLRSEMIAAGMKAEYRANQLVINGKIIVKKEGDSLEVEGPLCEDFYKVRSAVCGQFITL